MNRIQFDVGAMIRSRSGLIERLARSQAGNIHRVASEMSDCLAAGGRVFVCGNGGSASQAEHFSAELVGRFNRDRPSLPVYSLAENGAVMSSLANDYSFDDVFAHQIDGVGRKGDCLLAMSTSGESENVVRACRVAKEKGLRVHALTGEKGGRVAAEADVAIRVADDNTARIQEMHLLVVHLVCHIVESTLYGGDAAVENRIPT